MEGEGDGRAALERRIDEEVARVREAARADVATLREEARAALERETRLLRDMRDRAQHDADVAAAEAKACRQALGDAAVQHRTMQHRADVRSSTLAADLKIMGADLDRAKVRPPLWYGSVDRYPWAAGRSGGPACLQQAAATAGTSWMPLGEYAHLQPRGRLHRSATLGLSHA